MDLLKDIAILISESLFEEAEKRLISYLADNPHDEKAVAYLSKVERHLYLQKKVEVSLPSTQEAFNELRKLAKRETIDDKGKAAIKEFLTLLPANHLVDTTVWCGSVGFHDIWSEMIEHVALLLSSEPESKGILAEAYGWLAHFYLEGKQPLRARKWAEKGMTHLTAHVTQTAPKLFLELNRILAQSLWESGEHVQALGLLKQLRINHPQESEIRWMIEEYEHSS